MQKITLVSIATVIFTYVVTRKLAMAGHYGIADAILIPVFYSFIYACFIVLVSWLSLLLFRIHRSLLLLNVIPIFMSLLIAMNWADKFHWIISLSYLMLAVIVCQQTWLTLNKSKQTEASKNDAAV